MKKHYVASATKIEAKNWQYTLTCGKDLRDAIEAEDLEGVIWQLKNCYEELRDHALIDDDDFERYTEDFDYYDFDDEDIEDSIDWELGQFYDLCDNINVWIPVR